MYVLKDAETGEVVRTGRTNDLVRSESGLARDSTLGDYDFELAYRTNNYAEQRGLEQFVYALCPDAPFNYVRPISPSNLKKFFWTSSDDQSKEARDVAV